MTFGTQEPLFLVRGTNEVQTITLGGPTAGSFSLTFGVSTTAAIPSTTVPLAYNATAAQVQAALESLPTIGPGGVAVSGGAGGPYTVTFQGVLAGGDMPQLFLNSFLTRRLAEHRLRRTAAAR